MSKINLKYREDKILQDILKHVESTYSQHYVSKTNHQMFDDVLESGDAIPFCRWNAMKYLKRYGKKNGYNRDDLLKAAHLILWLLYDNDNIVGIK